MRISIEHGRVIDPANRIDSALNVLIEDGKIAALTRDIPENAHRRIDATGRVVCPGFLDIHMHEAPEEDLGDLEHSIFGAMLRMGVTTALGGNCGENVMPPPDYMEKVRDGLPINLGLMAGHGCARETAGFTDKYATLNSEEIQQVKAVMADWLEKGCLGISYGLRYVPGLGREELMETARLAEGTDMPVSAHVRDDAAYIFGAIQEFLEPGRELGLRLQVSHLGSMGGYGQMAEVLAMLDEARNEGVDVLSDCYPYSAFSTQIGETTYDPGFLERYGCQYKDIILVNGPHAGEECTKEIFDELRRDWPDTITVAHVMQEEDVRLCLSHPGVLLCSDGLLNARRGHPRAAGSFPRLIAEYVRKGDLSLYAAIEKMTSLPAARMNLSQKGNLSVGSDADLVIFDPETIRDGATFDDPDLPPEGIDYVLLAGAVACDHGKVVETRLGRVIRK